MKKLAMIALSVIFLTACNSPLLSHVEADEIIRNPISQKPSDCPLLFAKQGLCASWTWAKAPNDEDFAQAQVRFWKVDEATSSGPYVDPSLTVSAKLWMPSMGHGSSPVTVQRHLDASGAALPGIFDVSKVYFSMPGPWEVWLQLKQDGKVVEQAKLDVWI